LVVIDHGSTDATLRVAREYGARIRNPEPNLSPGNCLASAVYDWVLYILPSESLTEGLEASLYEWKLYAAGDVASIAACSAFVREETRNGWTEGRPSTRLIPKGWNHWDGDLPREVSNSMMLQGELLRFRLP
jgi:glycosyltransferase involved in cell wall biosynthesis